MNMIYIDGSHGEGGGQILRTAISLSSVLGLPVLIDNIRANRSPPGLKPQHLTGIQAAAEITGGSLKGDSVGSQKVEYHPGTIKQGAYSFDTGTAGSITLVAQTILPIMMAAPGKVSADIAGGTHVNLSPSYDYMKEVLLPALENMGIGISINVERYGFYPKGGGKVKIEVENKTVRPLTSIRPLRLDHEYKNHVPNIINGRIVQSITLPGHIIEREIGAIKELMPEATLHIEHVIADTYSPGNAITLWCNHNGFRGAYSLGRPGKPAEDVAKEAVRDLKKELKAPVDRHLADQLMVFCALAGGTGESGESVIETSEITSHTKTNAYVINSFLPNTVEIEGNTIKIKGIGDGEAKKESGGPDV